MDWQKVAEEQALIIENLSQLCHEILYELSQYKNIEAEEKRLSELTKEDVV